MPHAHDPLSPFTEEDRHAKFMAKVATDHLRLWAHPPKPLLVTAVLRWVEEDGQGPGYPVSGDVLARLDPTRLRHD